MEAFIQIFFDEFIDKVYVFFTDQGNVSFFVPVINLDFVYVLVFIIITFNFIFDMLFILLSRGDKK